MLTHLYAEVEDTLRMVLLQKRCVNCPSGTPPSCAPCRPDQVCSQLLQTCDACAATSCVNKSAATNTGVNQGGSSGPNVGAIAGGVVGGVAVIALLTFLVYWYGVRGKRQQQDFDAKTWEEQEWEHEKARSEFSLQRDARSSTHTVTSMASTVLTRASNVIQIAYIPGVTQRNPTSPGVLVPPVPPIPIALGPESQTNSQYLSGQPDTLYFGADAIRDSTYSGVSTIDGGRNSYARVSMAPSISPSLARSSVATTIFRGNAVASPVPAQTVLRGKAAVVSVKSTSSNSPNRTPEMETPPVPLIDYSKHSVGPKMVKVPSSSDGGSMRSTATIGKPVPVSIIRGKPSTTSTSSSSRPSGHTRSRSSSPKGLGLNRLTEVSVSSAKTHERAAQSPHQTVHSMASSDEDSDTEPHARSRQSLLNKSGPSGSQAKNTLAPGQITSPAFTELDDTPQISQSPFSDGRKDRGPFGDENKL